MELHNKVFVVSGPTASGKTFLAIRLAKKYNAIILNADSMQIYKGLPVLSAQPDADELKQAEHRIFNLLEIYESNSVFKWLELVKKESKDIFSQNKNIVIVGGTGMYISRLINGIIDIPDTDIEIRNRLNTLYDEIGWEKFYEKAKLIDPEFAATIKKNDKHKIIRICEIYELCGKKMSDLMKQDNQKLFDDKQIFHINLFPNREILYDRCEKRFKLMLQNDLVIDEVRQFLIDNKEYVDSGKKFSVYTTIGFNEIKQYLENKLTREEMFELSVKNTRNYAKRQYTWFRNQFKTLDFLLNDIPNKNNYERILEDINNKLIQQ